MPTAQSTMSCGCDFAEALEGLSATPESHQLPDLGTGVKSFHLLRNNQDWMWGTES